MAYSADNRATTIRYYSAMMAVPLGALGIVVVAYLACGRDTQLGQSAWKPEVPAVRELSTGDTRYRFSGFSITTARMWGGHDYEGDGSLGTPALILAAPDGLPG